MKRCLFAISVALGALAPSVRADIGLDDTYDQVIAEKGQPTGRASAGDSVILRYPDGSIRLKAGKVVAINLKPGAEGASHAVATSEPTRAPAPVHDAQGTPAPAPAAGRPRTLTSGPALAWKTDYRAALALAKDQDRHIFVFFTGSDWCGWCKALNREILSQPAFREYARDNLILVEVDFPRDKPQPAALKKQNEALQRAFQIEGYPTVVVLNSAGREVGRLGYQEGGPDPFVQALKKM